MSLQIAYTDRDTLIIACGNILTEVPLTPPPDSPSSGTSASRPAPQPTSNRNNSGGETEDPAPFITAPKHGPRTMLIKPFNMDFGARSFGYPIVRTETRSRGPRVVTREELHVLMDSLAKELPGRVTILKQVQTEQPVINCYISRDAMRGGFSTEPIERLFAERELTGLVSLQLSFDSDTSES